MNHNPIAMEIPLLGPDPNELIERGVDPREEVRARKARAMSVSEAHVTYIAAMRRGDRKTLKPRTIYDKEVIFMRDIEPRLGKKALSELTKNECWDELNTLSRFPAPPHTLPPRLRPQSRESGPSGIGNASAPPATVEKLR